MPQFSCHVIQSARIIVVLVDVVYEGLALLSRVVWRSWETSSYMLINTVRAKEEVILIVGGYALWWIC